MNQIFWHECGVSSLSNNLAAYYKFDGNANASVGGVNGTLNGSPSFVTGKIGNAIDFGTDAVSRDVTFADSDIFSLTAGAGADIPYSMSMWVRLNTLGVTHFLAIKRTAVSSFDEWQLAVLNTNNVAMYKIDRVNNAIFQSIRTNTALTSGVFHHIVITDNGSKTVAGMNIYLNGTLAAKTDQSAGVYTGMNNSNSTFRIGNNLPTATSTLKLRGYMDEFAIWRNRELNSTEVTQLYNSGNGITYPF